MPAYTFSDMSVISVLLRFLPVYLAAWISRTFSQGKEPYAHPIQLRSLSPVPISAPGGREECCPAFTRSG
jgi:hypothetical protein